MVDKQHVIIGTSEDMSEVENGSVRLFVTSPPYWNLKNYGHSEQIGAGGYREYLARLGRVWLECYQKGTDASVLVVMVNSRRVGGQFYPIAHDIIAQMPRGWILWDEIIRYVPNALPQAKWYMERVLDNKFETCLVFVKGGDGKYKFRKPRIPQKYRASDPRLSKMNSYGRCLGNVIRVPAYRPPNIRQMGYHVAAFPETLVAFFIECYSELSDTVLDPFFLSVTKP